MPVRLKRAEKCDRPSLFRLFAAVFGTAPLPEEWEWKYDRNPSQGASVVALDGEEAVGFFGAFATRFVGGGADMPGTSGVDVMTAPGARRLGRQGLYRELGTRFVEENRACGIPFYFGFPNDRHRLAGERLLGFRTVERAGQWSRPVGAPGLLSRLRGRFRPVRAISAFSRSHEPLAELLRCRAGLRTDRSLAAVSWRYTARPGVGYLLFEATRGTVSRGFAAARVVGDRALLVDLQAEDETGGTIVDLLDAVEGTVGPMGARTIELRASRSGGLAARAAELGFREIETDTSLEVIQVDPAYPLERVAGSFDYRFCDHDVF